MEPRATVWFGSSVRGRGQLAESARRFGLTGLSETPNVTRPRLVEERTFRARELASPNDPNRTLPYGARLDASAVQAQADHSTTLRYRCQVACPSTGMTMTRPRNTGIDPITKPP